MFKNPKIPFASLRLCMLFSVLCLVASCANYNLHQSKAINEIPNPNPDFHNPIVHSIYLIGDVGEDLKTSTNSTLQILKKHLDQAAPNSSILFLGNNVSPIGMSSKAKKKKRKKAERQLNAQLDILENFDGRPIFLPGNRDWQRYGAKGVRREEKYIEEFLNKEIKDEDDWENYFLPDDGCPGPEVIEINEDLVIIVIDSQWWLMNWDEQHNFNSGCDIKSRTAFEIELIETIKDYKTKNIVIASHHPFKSAGAHGGHFTFNNHIFPVTATSKHAYVPLPLLGSFYLFLRQAGISKQDLPNRHYKELRETVINAANLHGEFILVAGHDNSLQYLKDDGQHFIVSGSGTRKTPTAKKRNAVFSYGQNGFSKIDFYKDGSAWVEFWIPSDASPEGEKIFRTKIKGKLPEALPEKEYDFQEYERGLDSIEVFPTTLKLNPLNNFATFMLGKRRRELYTQEYNFPTLDLSTFKGGLKVIKKGGGKQTNSLRLADSTGREYVMRALTKDLERGVPAPFNQLPYVIFLLSESYLGSHPFAPLALATLADAAKVYHTNPGIYYIPKQPVLGRHNDEFGSQVYLVEERPSKSWTDAANFGYAKKFSSTTKMIQKREHNHKHRVDQKWVARSRLFDMLIGDFDRHADQWRWTVTQTDKGYKLYRPVPRDRDQAFSNFDGFLMTTLAPYHALIRQLGTYDEDVGDFKWNSYNGRHFDHHFLNELSLEDWLTEAQYIKENLTDEIIEEAMRAFPPKVYEMTGKEIGRILKYRRDDIHNIAEKFYKHLAERSILHGSNKKEYFEVIRRDDEHTEVNMYASNKKGEKKERLYHRIFKTSETNELYIYGLEDDDVFHISGKVKRSIRLYLVGGLGKDKFVNESKVGGFGKKDRIFDSKKGNILHLGKESKNRTSNITKNNTFEHLGMQFDESNLSPLPTIEYNASDGIAIGLSATYVVPKFNKLPFGQLHRLKLNYASATHGLDAMYHGVFYEVFTEWDLVVNSEWRSDRYSYNFFGIGNETIQENDRLNFYRGQHSLQHLDVGIQRRFASEIGSFSIRPLIQENEVSAFEDRFIKLGENGFTAKDFVERWYYGFNTSLNFESVDVEVAPKDGFRFRNNFGWQKSFTGSKREFYKFGTDFTMYKSFGIKRDLVFATRLGTDLIRGTYDFYFVPALGQEENIRGFFGQRFRGRTTFFHTTDLRLRLGDWKNSILPMSIGITGSYDYGRVFEPNEDSDKWHSSAGGSLWIMPLNLAVISVSFNKAINEKGIRLAVIFGHAF